MKYKYLRKVLSMAVALSLVMHSVVYNGWGVKEVEACNPTQLFGDPKIFGGQYHRDPYIDNAVGLEIFLVITPSARNAVLTTNEVYRNVERWGGWNGVEMGNRTIRTTVSEGNAQNPVGIVPVWGETFTFPLENTLGRIQAYNRHGNETSAHNPWHSVEIQMNRDVNVWGPTSISLANRQVRASKVFIHEVGHVLKLAHPQDICTQAAVMRQGFPVLPGVPGGTAGASRNITAHDLQAIAWKW